MLTLFPTPIGNLQDISYISLEKLSGADIILCEDTRVTKQLLMLLAQRYESTFKAQLISFFEHNQYKRLESFEESFFEQEVVFVSDAGMPAISDPGASLINYCRDRGIAYDVLPGANAALTAFAASGFEGAFTFYGFLPHQKRAKELDHVLQMQQYVILYEAPHRIKKLLEELKKHSPRREVFLAKEISKKFQTFYKGRVKDIAIENEKGEWVVILSPSEEKNIELTQQEVLNLKISDKIKSKLLAKTATKTAKEWYNELTKGKL